MANETLVTWYIDRDSNGNRAYEIDGTYRTAEEAASILHERVPETATAPKFWRERLERGLSAADPDQTAYVVRIVRGPTGKPAYQPSFQPDRYTMAHGTVVCEDED